MKKQFVTFMAILGVSAALVGCNSQTTENTPPEEVTTDHTTSEASSQPTTATDETVENENAPTSTQTPTLETEDVEKTEEKVESKPTTTTEVTTKPQASTKPESTTKPQASTKPESTTKPQAPTKPEASTKPESTTKPEASTKPESTTKPEASTKPESTTKPEASTKPESTTKPEASTKPESTTKPEASTKPEVPKAPETTSLSSSEVFSQITSGLELPNQMEADADLLMNLYGIDASLLESYCVKMPMMSFQITEIGVFKVKDTNNVDSIVAGINKRADSVGSMLYPSLQEIFDSRVVVTKGNYILFAMDENASTIAANFNHLIK